MTESNTGNTYEMNYAKPAETPKQTILNSSTIYTEYFDEDKLYPSDVLAKYKKDLEIIRSRKDMKFQRSRSPVRRPANDKPLHEVFKNIMIKDWFSSFLACESDINDKTSPEDDQMKPLENSAIKSHTGTKNVEINVPKSDKPLVVEKPKQISSTKKSTKTLQSKTSKSLKKKTVRKSNYESI